MLVPEAILAGHEDELRPLLEGCEFPRAVDPYDEFYGLALRRALLFARWPSLLNDGHPLSEQVILYNYYYWYSIFAGLYAAKHGFNADIEEQSIQILGTAQPAVDWSIIEQIDCLVEDEVAAWASRNP